MIVFDRGFSHRSCEVYSVEM